MFVSLINTEVVIGLKERLKLKLFNTKYHIILIVGASISIKLYFLILSVNLKEAFHSHLTVKSSNMSDINQNKP